MDNNTKATKEKEGTIRYDYKKLVKKIDDKFDSAIDFNNSIKWDEGDIFKKLDGYSQFTVEEMNRIKQVLKIKPSEMSECFFTIKTDKKEVDSKSLLEVSDKLFNVIKDLEILIAVDNNIADRDEELAEIMTWDYLKKAEKEAVETYELLNKIGNIDN